MNIDVSKKSDFFLRLAWDKILNKKASLAMAIVFFLELVFFDKLGSIDVFENMNIRLIFLGLSGVLFFYLSVIEASDLANKSYYIVGSICIFTLLFWFWHSDYNNVYLVAQIPLILLVTFLFHKSILNSDDFTTFKWQNEFFITVCEAIFIGVIFMLVWYLLFFLIQFVFEVEIPTNFKTFIVKSGASIVPSVVYLSRSGVERFSPARFSEGVIKMFLYPVWGIWSWCQQT